MYGRQKFTSIDEAQLDIFLKTYKPNKNVLKGKIRRTDGGTLCSRVLQKKILRTTFVSNIWHNAFSLRIMPSLPEKNWIEFSGGEI